jgi:hypothetical protein
MNFIAHNLEVILSNAFEGYKPLKYFYSPMLNKVCESGLKDCYSLC